MIRKTAAVVLAAMIMCGAQLQAIAAAPLTDKTLERVKNDVRTQGTGERSKVSVKMKDGRKLKGYISQALDDSFDLTDAKTRQPTTIPYGDVAEVKKSGWSSGAKIALGIGIGAAAVIAVVAGALAKDPLGSFCPLGC